MFLTSIGHSKTSTNPCVRESNLSNSPSQKSPKLQRKKQSHYWKRTVMLQCFVIIVPWNQARLIVSSLLLRRFSILRGRNSSCTTHFHPHLRHYQQQIQLQVIHQQQLRLPLLHPKQHHLPKLPKLPSKANSLIKPQATWKLLVLKMTMNHPAGRILQSYCSTNWIRVSIHYTFYLFFYIITWRLTLQFNFQQCHKAKGGHSLYCMTGDQHKV